MLLQWMHTAQVNVSNKYFFKARVKKAKYRAFPELKNTQEKAPNFVCSFYVAVLVCLLGTIFYVIYFIDYNLFCW